MLSTNAANCFSKSSTKLKERSRTRRLTGSADLKGSKDLSAKSNFSILTTSSACDVSSIWLHLPLLELWTPSSARCFAPVKWDYTRNITIQHSLRTCRAGQCRETCLLPSTSSRLIAKFRGRLAFWLNLSSCEFPRRCFFYLILQGLDKRLHTDVWLHCSDLQPIYQLVLVYSLQTKQLFIVMPMWYNYISM